MHDATAKIPSGIFNGNLNQYGDFDQCLNVAADNRKFQGKYCIAYLQPRSRNGTMKDLLKLVQSHEFFKSNFDDVRDILQFLLRTIMNTCVLCFLRSVVTGLRDSRTSIGPFVCRRAALTATWNLALRRFWRNIPSTQTSTSRLKSTRKCAN